MLNAVVNNHIRLMFISAYDHHLQVPMVSLNTVYTVKLAKLQCLCFQPPGPLKSQDRCPSLINIHTVSS